VVLTVEDVAEQLAVPASWVAQAARRGILPSRKVGRYRRFLQADVDEYLEGVRQGERYWEANPLALSTRSVAALRRVKRAP